tara:strand:+ start:405 stop:1373 length:969 start_codon:yes stop_codon:yes gene_type:complete
VLRHSLILLIFPVSLLAQSPEETSAAAWPSSFKTKPVDLRINDQTTDGSLIVTSRHFRMVVETRIGRQDLARFTRVVESVPQLMISHPLPLWTSPQRSITDILLCKDESSFVKAGGDKGAVGWWDGHRERILIRADYFLSPPQAENSRLQARPDEGLLVHELVHAGMSGSLWRLPPWFTEGIAEYFSVCHQGDGWYLFRDLDSLIRNHLRHAIGRNKVRENFHLIPVSSILGLDHQGWIKSSQNQPAGNAYLPYATALLLVHYHLHGGAGRRGKTSKHLGKIQRLSPRDKSPAFPTEEPGIIQKRLVDYWSSRGLQLVFRAQ